MSIKSGKDRPRDTPLGESLFCSVRARSIQTVIPALKDKNMMSSKVLAASQLVLIARLGTHVS